MEKEKDELLNPEDFEDDSKKEKGKEKEETQDEGSKEDENGKIAEDDEKAKAEAEEQKKRNAEYAKKRREQEEAERKKREAQIREETKREVELGIYKTNTFTNEPIVDEEDLEIYKIMKSLEEEGLDPINDLPKRIAKLNKEKKAENQKKAEQEKKEQENLSKDIADFVKKYPSVNLKELADNDEFIKFSNGKVGRWTTAEIYEAFMANQKAKDVDKKQKDEDKEIDKKADQVTKTPSTNHGKNSSTVVDLDKMSAEEFEDYFEKKYN